MNEHHVPSFRGLRAHGRHKALLGVWNPEKMLQKKCLEETRRSEKAWVETFLYCEGILWVMYGVTVIYSEDGISSNKQMTRQWTPLRMEKLPPTGADEPWGTARPWVCSGGTRETCEYAKEDVSVGDGSSTCTICLSNPWLSHQPVHTVLGHSSRQKWKELILSLLPPPPPAQRTGRWVLYPNTANFYLAG